MFLRYLSKEVWRSARQYQPAGFERGVITDQANIGEEVRVGRLRQEGAERLLVLGQRGRTRMLLMLWAADGEAIGEGVVLLVLPAAANNVGVALGTPYPGRGEGGESRRGKGGRGATDLHAPKGQRGDRRLLSQGLGRASVLSKCLGAHVGNAHLSLP